MTTTTTEASTATDADPSSDDQPPSPAESDSTEPPETMAEVEAHRSGSHPILIDDTLSIVIERDVSIVRRSRDDFQLPHFPETLLRAVAEIDRDVAMISIRIVGDERMRAIHREHLGIDATTDVMTFDMTEEGGPIEVDLILCADEALRQAEARGHAIECELLLYAIHGLLHCAGFDDKAEEDAACMHAEEDRILEAIGIGVTFARTRAGGET